MKKSSAIKTALTFVLAFVLAVFPLAGCKKKLTPAQHLQEAVNNSTKLSEDNKYTTFFKKMLNGGSLQLDYKDSEKTPILNSDLSVYTYMNETDGNYYTKVSVIDGSDTADSKIYVTKDSVAIDIANKADVYGIDLKNFKENLKNSALNTEDANLDEVFSLIDDLKTIFGAIEKNTKAASDSFNKNANITGEETKDGGYIVHVALDGNTIANILKDYYDAVSGDESFKKAVENIKNSELVKDQIPTGDTEDTDTTGSDDKEETFEESFNKLLDSLKNGKADIKADITLDKDNAVQKSEYDIDVDIKIDENTVKYTEKGAVDKSSANITGKTVSTVDGDEKTAEYTVSIRYSDTEFYLESNFTVLDDENPAKAKIVVDCKNGAYTLSVEATGDESDDEMKASISGNFRMSDDEINASVDKLSVKAQGVEISVDFDLKLKLKAKADEGMPSVPEYKELTSLTENEIKEIFGDIIFGGDDDALDDVSWPDDRINGNVPEPSFDAYIDSIIDEGTVIQINYSGFLTQDDADEYVAALKSGGFTNEKELDSDFDMGEYNSRYQATNDSGYGVGVYYYDDYVIAVLIYIPEDKVVNYEFPSTGLTAGIDAPNFGSLDSMTMKDNFLCVAYSGTSVSDIQAYEDYLTALGFTSETTTNYDSLGEHNFSRKNSDGYTVVVAAQSDGSGTFLVYVIVMKAVNMPLGVPDFTYGILESSYEMDGVVSLAYSDTTEDDIAAYVVELKASGFTKDISGGMPGLSDITALSNDDGLEVYVYYLGDGMTGIMIGELSSMMM